MSRFLWLALLLVAIGCARNEAGGPPESKRNPEPAVAIGNPVPPDDGSIPPPHPLQVRSREQALALGVDYLLARQSKDGAWRSDVYATFKDGTALTPLAVTALQEAYDAGVRSAAAAAAIKNGCAFLAPFAKADGTVAPPADGFDYPVYTAALTLKAFSHPTAADFANRRGGWVKYLKDRQLTETLGWKPDEKQYGGWGYCRVIPKKPEPGAFAPNLIESNLSATAVALEALKAAGEADAQTCKAAAIFVRRCQNWKGGHAHFPPQNQPDPAADGGFHFIYDDPVRNKAGEVAGAPGVFHSYGSTTADGLRALQICGAKTPHDSDGLVKEDQDRQRAALAWFARNFRADAHPGVYLKAHEPNRNAVYYYYAASVSPLLAPDLGAALSSELAFRQAKDGSWANPIELVRENDPFVATSNALLALARCRKPL